MRGVSKLTVVATTLLLVSTLRASLVDASHVSVCRDATYQLPAERGPICSGAGAQPAGYACPKKGDVSKQDCHDNLPSYDGQGCVAKEDAVCEIVIGETWGCVFPSVGCSTLVPIPEPQCATWDFDDHDLVVNKGGNQVNRLLESISFEASQEDYDESWFVQDGPIRELYACGRKPTPAPTTPAPLVTPPRTPETPVPTPESTIPSPPTPMPTTPCPTPTRTTPSTTPTPTTPCPPTPSPTPCTPTPTPCPPTPSPTPCPTPEPTTPAPMPCPSPASQSNPIPAQQQQNPWTKQAPAPGKDGKGKGESDSNEQAQHQQSTPSSSPSTFRGTPHPASNAVSVSLKAESSAPEMTHSTILVAIACVAAAAVVMVIGVIKYARKRAQPMENDQFTRLQCASPASPSLPDAFPAL